MCHSTRIRGAKELLSSTTHLWRRVKLIQLLNDLGYSDAALLARDHFDYFWDEYGDVIEEDHNVQQPATGA